MRRIRLAALLLFLFISLGMVAGFHGTARAHPSPASTGVSIEVPAANSAIQGKVSIIGSAAADGMQSWSLEFGYTGDTTNTWFILAEGEQPVTDGTLAEWDTTTLSDGDYTLRLTAYQGETSLESLVPVRVRNYTPIETPTLEPTKEHPLATSNAQPATSLAPTAVAATPIPLPTNPAELTAEDVVSGIKTGAVLAVIIFLLTLAYVYLRHISRQ